MLQSLSITTLLMFIYMAHSYAMPWSIVPQTALPESAYRLYQEKYPDITSSAMLQSLMESIARKHPMMSLTADYMDGSLVLRAHPGNLIAEVDVKSTSNEIAQEVMRMLSSFINQVSTAELKQALREKVKKHLQERGYYRSKIRLKEYRQDQWLKIEVIITEDYPCRIQLINYEFKLPPDVDFDVDIGDICDSATIRQALEDTEDQLDEEGYRQKQILDPYLQYLPDNNAAILYIRGSLGKRISYEIQSADSGLFGKDPEDIELEVGEPEDMQSDILRSYQEEGYADAQVSDPEVQQLGAKDSIKYTFQVDSGTQYKINVVEFEGVRHFTDEEILDVTELSSVFGTSFTDEALTKATSRIQSLYLEHGFWDINIPYPRVNKNPQNGQVKLTFLIKEGQRRQLSQIKITGESFFSESEILEYLGLPIGQSLSWNKLVSIEKRLKDLYNNKGYIYTDIKVKLTESRTFSYIQTNLEIIISEGQRARFGEITVSGLFETSSQVVHRELRFQPGEWFDPQKLEETERALLRLGIFSSVAIVLTERSSLDLQENELPYTILLREATPGSVAFGPGWSLENGLRYVVEASYNNISGLGRKVFSKAKISEERSQSRLANKTLLGRSLSVGYIEPYVMEQPIDGAVNMGHRAVARSERWELSRSGEVSLSHTLRSAPPDTTFSVFYGRQVTIIESSINEINPLINTGNIHIGRMGFRLRASDIDNIAWPTRGYKLSAEVAWARPSFGGEMHYQRWNLKASTFVSLSPKVVFALGTSLTAYRDIKVKGAPAHVLPTSERLQTGGADSNRGFFIRSLGPRFIYHDREDGDWGQESQEAGGSGRGVYKAELRYQWSSTIGYALFTDVSNVFFSKSQGQLFSTGFAQDYSKQSEPPPFEAKLDENYPYYFEELFTDPKSILNKSYISWGLALNWITPLGAVVFSYGLPYANCPQATTECTKERKRGPKQEAGRLPRGTLQISIGANF